MHVGQDLAPVTLQREVQPVRRLPVEPEQVISPRLVRLLRRRVVHRVPRVRDLQTTATHARQTTTHRLPHLQQLPGVQARLIRQREVDRVTQLRVRCRRDRVDTAIVRQTDETLTNLHLLLQRPPPDHLLQRPIHVVRLILSRRQQLDRRHRPGNAHRLARLVHVRPATRAAVILTPVYLAAQSPASEDARPHSLERHNRRTPRRLTRLLRANHQTTPVHEHRRASRALRVKHRTRLHPVEVHRAPHLPAVMHERIAHRPTVSDLAVRLNPVRSEETERGEIDDPLVSHQTRPSSGHATTDAASPPPTPSRQHARPPRLSRPSNPSPPGRPSSSRSDPRTGAPDPAATPEHPAPHTAPTSAPTGRPCAGATPPTASPTRKPAESATPAPTPQAHAQTRQGEGTRGSRPGNPPPAAPSACSRDDPTAPNPQPAAALTGYAHLHEPSSSLLADIASASRRGRHRANPPGLPNLCRRGDRRTV